MQASVEAAAEFGTNDGFSTNAGVEGRQNLTEYGAFGISIDAIAPGAIMTPMVENSLKRIDPDNWQAVREQFVSATPMQRFGEPDEIAALVAFLLSGGLLHQRSRHHHRRRTVLQVLTNHRRRVVMAVRRSA